MPVGNIRCSLLPWQTRASTKTMPFLGGSPGGKQKQRPKPSRTQSATRKDSTPSSKAPVDSYIEGEHKHLREPSGETTKKNKRRNGSASWSSRLFSPVPVSVLWTTSRRTATCACMNFQAKAQKRRAQEDGSARPPRRERVLSAPPEKRA